MSAAEALGLAVGVVALLITRVVRSELQFIARDALRTRSGKRWLPACRVATWDVYAATVVVVTAASLIASVHWEKDPALTVVFVAVLIGIVGGLSVERLTGGGAAYWGTVESSLEQAVRDPSSRKSQRDRFNEQRSRLMAGPPNERDDAVEAILRS